MLSLPWPIALSLALVSFGLAGLILVNLRDRVVRQTLPTPLPTDPHPIAMLFENDRLIDATDAARRLLATGPRNLRMAERMKAVLAPLFPELDARLRDIGDGGSDMMRDGTTGATLTAGRAGGLLRLRIENLPEESLPPAIEPASLEALDKELDLLQATLDRAPVLIWREDGDGHVRWANRAYIELAEERADTREITGWPLPTLFDTATPAETGVDRRVLEARGTAPKRQFDVMTQSSAGLTTFYAVPADRLAQAEASLHDFVQTLSRTFADLPTGLAVFDKERRLALFNPALADLTGLEPIFLATRPLLSDFLDALRNRQRMPEPKNYKNWRDRIASLEQAAVDGSYLEDWSLPNGQTFRVTGQPHPNGGIAFLFEDISAEVSLTRSFRAELALSQSVLDTMEEALAVFSGKGTLILVNDAYRRLWGNDPSTQLIDAMAEDVLLHWRGECRPTADWGPLQTRLLGDGVREAGTYKIRLKSGRALGCRVAPLPGQATLVGFAPDTAARPVPSGEWLNPAVESRATRTIGL